MFVAGYHIAVERVGNVVHAENEVIVLEDAFGPLHEVHILEQGHDVARAGVQNSFLQTGEGADVNHGTLGYGSMAYMAMKLGGKASPAIILGSTSQIVADISPRRCRQARG